MSRLQNHTNLGKAADSKTRVDTHAVARSLLRSPSSDLRKRDSRIEVNTQILTGYP